MRTILNMRALVLTGLCVVAAACANTSSGGGGTAATDTGSSADTGSASDTGSGTGQDVTSGGSDATSGGTDAISAGTTTTISAIQQDPSSTGCTNDGGFVDGAKGITILQVIVTSPVSTTTSKTSGKTSDAVWVQSKGGGAWSGVELYAASPGPLTGLKVGQVISVTGDVSEAYCVTEIKPVTVTPSGTTDIPTPVTVDVDTIGTAMPVATNESYEGVLVSLENVIVADPGVLGTDGKIHYIAVGKSATDKAVLISSGFGNYVTDKTGAANYKAGDKLTIQGIWSYYHPTGGTAIYSLTPISITKN